VIFIDTLYDRTFYQQLPLNYRNSFIFGQFFWTHAYYPHENLEFWRPIVGPNEPTQTQATAFEIKPNVGDAFRKRIPLKDPKLEANEEFLVIRAKRRPVILIQPEMPRIEANTRGGYRGRIQRRRSLVAQIFGLYDLATGREEFPPSFVDRVRSLEFPQLMFLPKQAGLLDMDSLLRLDELQSVFTPHLDPTQHALCDDLARLLRDQFQFVVTQQGPNFYTEMREMILEENRNLKK
jgi:hypothetical protein